MKTITKEEIIQFVRENKDKTDEITRGNTNDTSKVIGRLEVLNDLMDFVNKEI